MQETPRATEMAGMKSFGQKVRRVPVWMFVLLLWELPTRGFAAEPRFFFWFFQKSFWWFGPWRWSG